MFDVGRAAAGGGGMRTRAPCASRQSDRRHRWRRSRAARACRDLGSNCRRADFILRYNADGTLQNGEDSGRWVLDGDIVSETISERFEMGSDAPVKLDPPEKRTYSLERIDAGKGSLTFKGKKIPIQRC
jgi:hypothetical protein